MKTVKYAVITLVVAFAALSIAHADGFTGKPPAKKVISLTLQQAIQDPQLVVVMYQQIDPSFLKVNQPMYVNTVTYKNYLVRITGTYDQWVLFFRHIPGWE
jgi:hypothetical protein